MINLYNPDLGVDAEKMENARRRSSNRSIKRRKFDDELVEYSLGLPGVSNLKNGRARSQSLTAVHPEMPTTSTSSVPSNNLPTTSNIDIKRKSFTYLFRSWGRIGTTIGGTKLEDFSTLLEEKKQFYFYYEDKTGNKWQDRDHFVKVPNRMYPVDVDFGDEEEAKVDLNLETP